MKKFALLGHDIGYSLSPKIHDCIYRYFGTDASYTLLSVPREELPAAVDVLRSYDGFNVTKPYKLEILRYLDEDKSGIGTVNTVVSDNGRLTGYTTDGFGFMRHFEMAYGSPRGRRCLVLGAGGVARIIVPELVAAGADVAVFNRTEARAAELAGEFGCSALRRAETAGYRPHIVVNCTSCGLKRGENPLPPIDKTELEFAYDTIYSPPVTDFMKSCAPVARTENGLGMLILQAIKADEYLLKIDTMSDINTLYGEIKKEISYEIADS